MPSRRPPKIRVGTCGFSYRDWIGPFYPPGSAAQTMLPYYARHFAAVEIDSTYYRVPPPRTFAAMAERTPPSFRFTVKLPSTATHVPDLGVRAVHGDVALLRAGIAPLVDAQKVACVLAQFPNAFRPGPEADVYLARLRDAIPDVALVAEFRHRDWQTHATLELLSELEIGLVNVDQPHFKTLLRESSDVTAPIAYVRFHGRNAEQWWRGTNETRYDYLYTPDELLPWVDRILDVTADPDVKEVFAFFNNHRRGQAIRNAEMLIDLLKEHGAEVAEPPAAPAPEPAILELPLGTEDACRMRE